MSKWIKITELQNVPSMGSRIIIIGDYEIVLFKIKGNLIFAVDNECPHKQGKLSEGLVHEKLVTCPLHNWDIDLETGIAKDENNACTKKYETKIEEGVIYIAF